MQDKSRIIIYTFIGFIFIIFICICCFISSIVFSSFTRVLLEGPPVAEESDLSRALKEHLFVSCQFEPENTKVEFPEGIPHRGWGYYDTRDGGSFNIIIKSTIDYNYINSSVDTEFKIYVGEDKVLVEEIDGNIKNCK